MRISTILQGFVDRVVADTGFQSWVSSNLGGTLNVYYSIDNQNSGGSKTTPLIIFLPGPTSKGEEAAFFQYQVSIMLAHSVNVKTNSGIVTKSNNVELMDEFADRLFSSLIQTSNNYALSNRDELIDVSDDRKITTCEMNIRINVPHTIGGEEPTL